jgi:phosphoribosyl 1,2-cyclic phosphodiesterase
VGLKKKLNSCGFVVVGMDFVFLGTGGGRWMTITQRRHTGGFRIHGQENIHVDPGAGAVARAASKRINPLSTKAVLVSHCHPDHYTDAEVFIEAMTKGMTKKAGLLAASRSVINGNSELGPAVSRYHRSKLAEEHVLSPGDTFKIGNIGVEALPTRHSDPDGVGFKFYTDQGIITYTSDTEYFDEMTDVYKDSSLMIINVIRPKNEHLKWHLCSNEVIKILNEIRPQTAIISHFGMKMIPIAGQEASRIERETGVQVIAARDGMRYTWK